MVFNAHLYMNQGSKLQRLCLRSETFFSSMTSGSKTGFILGTKKSGRLLISRMKHLQYLHLDYLGPPSNRLI